MPKLPRRRQAKRKAKREADRQKKKNKKGVTKMLLDIVAYAAVLIAAIFFTLFGVYWSDHRVTAIIFFGIAILSSDIALCAYWISKEQVQPEQPAKTSQTSPSAEPSTSKLERPKFRQKLDTGDVTINIGSNTYRVPLKVLERSPQEFPVYAAMSDYNPIRIHAKNGHPLIDVQIWGGSNRAAVEVKENEFTVKPGGWDSNSNTNALEIVNEHQKPVLQLFYKNPMYIVVNGVFPSPVGVLYASEQGIEINPEVPPQLKPIFKYPSWQYPGQYAEP